MRALALAALLVGCRSTSSVMDPDLLSGSIVRVSRTEIEVASDLADSATTRVRGVDGVALGLAPGDRVRVRRLDPWVGKTDPLDWDCSAPGACNAARE